MINLKYYTKRRLMVLESLNLHFSDDIRDHVDIYCDK